MNLQDKKAFLEQFGNRVKQTRIEKGMTLEELANRIGYTTENARSSVQKIEAGKRVIHQLQKSVPLPKY